MTTTFTNFFSGALHSKAAHWMAVMVAATLHISVLFAVTFPAGTVLWMFPLLVAAPGLLTMLLIPGAWRKWHRWAVVVFLAFSVYPELLAIVLTVGTAWALYRSWFAERNFPLKKIFTAEVRKRPADGSPKPEKSAPAVKDAKDARFSDVTDILFKDHRAKKDAKAATRDAKAKGGAARPKAPAGV
ncbi:MAG TPA: hypothetical protein VF885_18295 [Arthrobacter sp.]